MGLISKQAIRGSILSYLGITIGFVTVGLLYPKFLTPEQIGLINFIVSVSLVFCQIGTLGFGNIATRLFPHFRNKDTFHHGFGFVILFIFLSGSILIIIFNILFKDFILKNKTDQEVLLSTFYYLVIPASIGMLIFKLLESYFRVSYNALIGIFTKEFLFRLLVLGLVGLYIVDLFSFKWFINIYVLIYISPAFFLLLVLLKHKDLSFRPDYQVLTKDMVKAMINVGLFALISGFGRIAISSVDRIMLVKLTDLNATGIYSIAFFFGSIINLPSRSIGSIASAFIADAFKNNDMKMIKDIYHKTCLNQLIFGTFIFLVLWLNVDGFLQFLPRVYDEGKYVIFFIALGNLVDMGMGINSRIINTSQYYKVHTYFVLGLLIGLIITNLIFIPLFGIVGAAAASAITYFIFNIAKYFFIWYVFKMQPYTLKFLVIPLAALISYIIVRWIPELDHNILNILVKSGLITFMYGSIILFSGISGDINNKMHNYMAFVKRWMK